MSISLLAGQVRRRAFTLDSRKLAVNETAQFDKRRHGDPRLSSVSEFRTSGLIQHPRRDHELHLVTKPNQHGGWCKPPENLYLFTEEWMIVIADLGQAE